MAPDEEDGGDNSRKKLHLSKDQSAVLEESLKLNTLNPLLLHRRFRSSIVTTIYTGESDFDFEAPSPPPSAPAILILLRILFRGYTDQMVEDANAVILTFDKIGGSSTGVFATKITPAKDGKPVTTELIDAKTKEPKDTLEVDATLIATGRAPFTKGLGLENINVVTQRGFVPVDERMQVIDANGNLVPHLYCIGDANGKMILAYVASAQGISVVEQVSGKDHVLNHLSIPAACFTHPEITRERAEIEGFEISVAKTSFKAKTKALVENEGEGLVKLIYRPDNGEILGVHIFGLHTADLIHEASNAIALGTRIQCSESYKY
ncbi:hypothetical protein ACSBR2_001716 [Camellia fascicularis]